MGDKIKIKMNIKLLKKFRKRFVFSDANGYSEMMDRETGRIYGPEWAYCRSVKSVKEHLIDKAIELLTGKDVRLRGIELDYKKRRTSERMAKKRLLSTGTSHPYIKTLTALSLLCLMCAGCGSQSDADKINKYLNGVKRPIVVKMVRSQWDSGDARLSDITLYSTDGKILFIQNTTLRLPDTLK